MKFTDLIAALTAGETLPEDWHTQATEAYEYDMSVPNAKVESLEAALAGKDAEIAALKIHNYELLMGDRTDTENGTESEDENSDDTELTTDDLFTNEDEI